MSLNILSIGKVRTDHFMIWTSCRFIAPVYLYFLTFNHIVMAPHVPGYFLIVCSSLYMKSWRDNLRCRRTLSFSKKDLNLGH